MTCTCHQISLGRSDLGERYGQIMWLVLGTRKMCAACWWETLEKKRTLVRRRNRRNGLYNDCRRLRMEYGVNQSEILALLGCYMSQLESLTQDEDRWQPLVYRVTNIWSPVRCAELLDQLSNCQVLKKNIAPWNFSALSQNC